MIKTFFTAVLIFAVCSLENIGPYFGFCFHGWMANIIGSFSAIAIGLAVYSMDLKIWLKSRTYGKRKPHMCKDHHHDIPEDLLEGVKYVDEQPIQTEKFDGTRNWVKIIDDAYEENAKRKLLSDLLAFYYKHKEYPSKMSLECPFLGDCDDGVPCDELCGVFEEFEIRTKTKISVDCPCLQFGTTLAFEKLTKVLKDNGYLKEEMNVSVES
jgi:hypothetical protein